MNVVILSWEYPPRIIGGLGTHVHQLAVNLARLGANVHVITKDAPDAPDFERADGVQIHRVPLYPPEIPQDEWVPWTLQFNMALMERAVPIINERIGKVHVLHAHDWLVAHAAIALKHAYLIPLVATIHATEYGRHQGHIPPGMSKIIHQEDEMKGTQVRDVLSEDQEEKIKQEYSEVETKLNQFEYQEDAIEYLNTTTFKHFIPAKAIANSKPIKNK